ncbi:beta-lactamase/transpeptidase-like protein [Lineolata rhizophorae]|uniref:Beta-lactamase/transpeptidase-like protein n=1 Tax=Lineolata rhizophorae TaxID=578093 RepID=A0A6A6P976_9PEZI|nr:beta-lactamase/transpeptidase-like protein [Lineolata rhizophorae]
MARSLSAAGVSAINAALQSAVSGPQGVPGAVVCVVNRDGTLLFSGAAGARDVETGAPMTPDTALWIASCTKLITSVAAMQMVERGKLRLDDADQAEEVCPELRDVKLLKEGEGGELVLVEKTNRITLRKLLNHTAGFGYTFFNTKLFKWSRPIGVDEVGAHHSAINTPLVAEPGEEFNYGNIFEPLGIKDITMFPAAAPAALPNCPNTAQPQIILTQPPPLPFELLATLLNAGTSPTTHRAILTPTSVAHLFTNQIPGMPDFGRRGMPAAKPWYTNVIPDMYPQGAAPQGWGLASFITVEPGPTGRGAGAGYWAGLPNLYWWIDPEKGVGGIVGAQVFPFNDPGVVNLWVNAEVCVYQNLS